MPKQEPKLSPSELWAALEDSDLDDEMEAVHAMTPEERRRELQAAGFDLDEVHARADALGAAPAPAAPVPSTPAPSAPAAPVTVQRPKRRVGVVLPAAIAFAAVVAVVVYVASGPGPVSAHRPVDPPAVQAAELRQEARDACQAQRWPTCLDKLNEAKALDPAGDATPEVQALRRGAGEPGRP